MNIRCGVPGADRLPPAYRRAANLRADLGRAVGLFALGDRSEVVLRTLAAGKAAYDAIGENVPRPVNLDRTTWRGILKTLADHYGERPYVARAASSKPVARAG